RCRDQILWLGSILAWILYVQYVATGYIGRGDMVMAMALVGLALWMHRPRLRPALIAVAIMMLPVVLAASYIYGTIRIGGSVSDVGLLQIASVIDTETGFPRDVGMPIIESGM